MLSRTNASHLQGNITWLMKFLFLIEIKHHIKKKFKSGFKIFCVLNVSQIPSMAWNLQVDAQSVVPHLGLSNNSKATSIKRIKLR